ncbi:MAG TPA: PEP-CTERM sorting domain-containing protein [Rhizomicrobium sp.]|nr:PEP-CTERM sorting domain-containing protein [Rhizomicrobium sp.]
MRKMIFAAAMFAATMVGTSANAVPITWTLQGLTFDDGGTAYGSFVYDADTGKYTDVNITTTGKWAYTYTNVLGCDAFGFDANTGSNAEGNGFLEISTSLELTNAGGNIPFVGAANYETPYYANNEIGLSYRYIVAGAVVSPSSNSPVPEPWTLALVGAGLAGMAATRRRRKA